MLPDRLAPERSAANAGLPVLACHGTRDPMVPEDRGRACRDALVALGHPVEWHTWPMQHQVCAEEIAVIGAWLTSLLKEEA